MWVAGALLFGTCLLTLKRTGILASLAGILTIVLSRRGQGISGLLRRGMILVTAALLTLGLVHWQKEDVGERITDQSGSAYSRENIQPLYLGLALQRPVFGYGPAYPMGSEGTGYWEGSDYDFGPENSYLHIALTAGLVGLALFLWQFVFGLSRLWASSAAGGGEALAIAAGLAACAVGGLFVIAVGDLKGSGLPFYLLAWAHQCVPKNRSGVAHRVTN
jgi:O-antigen ligase